MIIVKMRDVGHQKSQRREDSTELEASYTIFESKRIRRPVEKYGECELI